MKLCSFHTLLHRNLLRSLSEKLRYHWSHCSAFGSQASSPSNGSLLQQLAARIRINGPITVADYMRVVLTNPNYGYYMHSDVFGSKGDFTTSPEISQMFGEMIGVWCVNEWQQSGSPAQIQVIELGPGRGTLSADMLRVFSQFDGIKDAVSLHLVEISPKLSQIQYEKLSGKTVDQSNTSSLGELDCYQKVKSKYGPDVYWYKQLPDVPKKFSFIVAHELFDALPIHKFQKQDDKWREVLVDTDPNSTELKLRYVLSPTETTALNLLLPEAIKASSHRRDHIEVCPDGGVLIQEIANRVELDGGMALIADYGHTGNKQDTFRAFKEHALHDPLISPGVADLTADVDFFYLKHMIRDRAAVYGPITQEKFLTNMGIGYRLQALLGQASIEDRKNLITGYDMMCNPEKMGERFKFMALLRHRSEKDDYLPAGFKSL